MVPCAFFCHFEDIAVRLVVLAGKCEVLLFQAFGLFRHFLHLFAESEEEFVAVVQRILNLKKTSLLPIGPENRERGMGWFPAYLLELLHVDVELTA